MSHPAFTLFTALLLAIATAAAGHRPARERFAVGLRMFSGCALAVVAGSWLMRLIHG